jgi:hypothetical protein
VFRYDTKLFWQSLTPLTFLQIRGYGDYVRRQVMCLLGLIVTVLIMIWVYSYGRIDAPTQQQKL